MLAITERVTNNMKKISTVATEVGLSEEKILEYIQLFYFPVLFCPYLSGIDTGAILFELAESNDITYSNFAQYITHCMNDELKNTIDFLELTNKTLNKIRVGIKTTGKFSILLPVKFFLSEADSHYLTFIVADETIKRINFSPTIAIQSIEVDSFAGFNHLGIPGIITKIISVSHQHIIDSLLSEHNSEVAFTDQAHDLNIKMSDLLLSTPEVDSLRVLPQMPSSILSKLIDYYQLRKEVQKSTESNTNQSRLIDSQFYFQGFTDGIARAEDNYIDDVPELITYEELVQRWKKKEKLQDSVRIAIKNGLIPYYKYKGKLTFSIIDVRRIAKPPEGESRYLKRYGNLQRIRGNTLNEILSNDNYECYAHKLPNGKKTYLEEINFLPTETEAWLGIHPISNPPVRTVQISELCFLLNDVKIYEHQQIRAEQQIPSTKNKSTNNKGSIFRKIVIYTIQEKRPKRVAADTILGVWDALERHDFGGDLLVETDNLAVKYKTNHGKPIEGHNKRVKKSRFTAAGSEYVKLIREYVNDADSFRKKYHAELTYIESRKEKFS